jgi:hypothetical protein
MSNQAEEYGVTIDPSPSTGETWRAILVRHLTGAENGGKHNVYVDVLDAAGNRDRNPALRIGWTWEGRGHSEGAPPKPLDKPDGEQGDGNVDMYAGQIVSVWIQGDGLPSDRVAGMHIMHPDEEPGNTWGHHSYYCQFQRVRGGTVDPPIDPPIDPDRPTDAAILAQLHKNTVAIAELTQKLSRWTTSWTGEL